MKKNVSVLSKKLKNDLDLLRRHVNMLQAVTEKEPIGIIKLAGILKLPQHKVRYSLRLLEKDGMIEATMNGAVTTRKTKKFLEKLKKNLGSMNETIKDIQKMLE